MLNDQRPDGVHSTSGRLYQRELHEAAHTLSKLARQGHRCCASSVRAEISFEVTAELHLKAEMKELKAMMPKLLGQPEVR